MGWRIPDFDPEPYGVLHHRETRGDHEYDEWLDEQLEEAAGAAVETRRTLPSHHAAPATGHPRLHVDGVPGPLGGSSRSHTTTHPREKE